MPAGHMLLQSVRERAAGASVHVTPQVGEALRPRGQQELEDVDQDVCRPGGPRGASREHMTMWECWHPPIATFPTDAMSVLVSVPPTASLSPALCICFLIFQRTMHLGSWLEGFGWGTDELVSPKEIYPAVVSAEAVAEKPATPGSGRKRGRFCKGKQPEHEPEAEEPAGAAPAETAQGQPVQGKGRGAAAVASTAAADTAPVTASGQEGHPVEAAAVAAPAQKEAGTSTQVSRSTGRRPRGERPAAAADKGRQPAAAAGPGSAPSRPPPHRMPTAAAVSSGQPPGGGAKPSRIFAAVSGKMPRSVTRSAWRPSTLALATF